VVLRLRVPRELAGEAQVDLGHLAAIARLNGAGGAGGAGGAANGSQDSRGATEAARDGDGRVSTLPAVRRGAGVGAEAASMGDAPAFEGGSLREALRQLEGLRVSAHGSQNAHGSHGSQEAAAHGAQDSGAAAEAAEAVGSLPAAQPAPLEPFLAAGEARHGAADEEASAGDGALAAGARGGTATRRAGTGAAGVPPEMPLEPFLCPITAQLMRDPASKPRRPLRRWRCC